MTRSVTNVDFLNDIGTVNAQTGTTYTVVSGDRGKLVTFTNASAIAVTQPQAGSTFPNGWFVDFQNRGAGTVTIAPTTSTVDGSTSIALTTGQGIRLFSDGTNYFTQRGLSVATTVLRNWISGLVLSNNVTDSANDIDIAVGEAADSTATYLMRLNSTLTKRLDAAWAAGTNQGGLDTGSEAASTWYHIWLIRKDSDASIDALFSTSATSPTMPSGYTAKRLIGSVYNNSSSNLRQFTAVELGGGLYTQWTDGVVDFSSGVVGTANTTFSIVTPSGYPTLATISFRINDGTSQPIYISSLTDPQTIEIFRNSASVDSPSTLKVLTNSNSQIRARSGTDTLSTLVVVSIAWEWGRR